MATMVGRHYGKLGRFTGNDWLLAPTKFAREGGHVACSDERRAELVGWRGRPTVAC